MDFLKKLACRGEDAFNQPAVTIACLGDSVTHGCFEVFMNRHGNIDTRYSPDDGYVGQLRRRLNRYCPAGAVSVINGGISGDSAPGGLKRLERDVLAHRPDLVTVCFGLNDSMNSDVETGLASYRSALEEIVRRVLDSGAECMLLTPNFMCRYVSSELPDGPLREIAADAARVQNEGILERYVDAMREVGEKMQIPVADAYASWQAMDSAGIDTTALLVNHINHPSAFAHELFVEAIWQKLLQ